MTMRQSIHQQLHAELSAHRGADRTQHEAADGAMRQRAFADVSTDETNRTVAISAKIAGQRLLPYGDEKFADDNAKTPTQKRNWRQKFQSSPRDAGPWLRIRRRGFAPVGLDRPVG